MQTTTLRVLAPRAGRPRAYHCCSVCKRTALRYTRGFCRACYSRWQRLGYPPTFALPARQTRLYGAPAARWTAADDTLLQAHAYASLGELEALFAERGSAPRSQGAIRLRLRQRYGVNATSAPSGTLTLTQVAQGFGVHCNTVTTWLRTGALDAAPRASPRAPYYIAPDAVARFLREHRTHYDWRAMPPGPWRREAELIWQCDPWFTIPALATRLGRSVAGVHRLLHRLDLFPRCIRHGARWWVPRGVVRELAAAIRQQKECAA